MSATEMDAASPFEENDNRSSVIHKDTCCVVEFPNEDNKVAVGYASWYHPPFSNSKKLDTAIKDKTILEMKWPKDGIVLEPSKMEKRSNNLEWIKAASRILAYGGEEYSQQLMVPTFSFQIQH